MAYRGLALFLGLAIFWGGSFPAIEVGLAYFPPISYAAARYALGGALMLAYAWAVADEWVPTRRDVPGVLGCGAFFIGGNTMLFVGQQFTTGGVASIIYSLIPILTAGFAWLLIPDDRPTLVGVVGVVIGLVGVVAIAQPDPSNLLRPDVIGKGLVFLAAISVAFGGVVIRLSKSTLPDSSFMAWSTLVGAVLIYATGVLVGESTADIVPAVPGLAALAYVAVISTAVSFVIFRFLVNHYGVFEANLVNYLVPVVATLVGWSFLNEPVTAWTIVGFVLIFGGFVLVKREALRDELRRVTWL